MFTVAACVHTIREKRLLNAVYATAVLIEPIAHAAIDIATADNLVAVYKEQIKMV